MERERKQVSVRLKSTQQHPQAPCASSSPLKTMVRVATDVQQIATVVNTAASEEENVMTVTRIVMSVMNLNGH